MHPATFEPRPCRHVAQSEVHALPSVRTSTPRQLHNLSLKRYDQLQQASCDAPVLPRRAMLSACFPNYAVYNLFLIRSICSSGPSTELMGSRRRRRQCDALVQDSLCWGWSGQRTKKKKKRAKNECCDWRKRKCVCKCQNVICSFQSTVTQACRGAASNCYTYPH